MADLSLQKILEEQVIDKLIPVIVKGDKDLADMIAKLGTRVGSASTYAELPMVDQNGRAINAGDTARLTATDGDHPAGIYEYNGTEYELVLDFDKLDIGSIIESAKATQAEFDAKSTEKFTTPAQVLAAVAEEIVRADGAYHPKGGDVNLTVVGKNAAEGTQEFVTASQLSTTFTVAEIQAKYDAL
jgi:hypothetical protein